jgi:hypothetical protein
MRTCTKCGIEKEDTDFQKRDEKVSRSKRRSHCRACLQVKAKADRLSNLDQRRTATREYMRRRRANDPDKENARCRAYTIRNPLKTLAHAAVARAKKYGLPYDRGFLKDLTIPDMCPILHVPLILRTLDTLPGEGRLWSGPSLDRILPELGYVPGNVRVISMMANSMKQNATPEQLRTFAANIGAYLEGR